MESIFLNWKLLVPIIVLQIALQIYALIDLIKSPAEEIRGPKFLWGTIIVCFQIVGVIVYFALGKL